jgi:putative FmdB family regulatory protein
MALYEYECLGCGNTEALFVLSEDRDTPPQRCSVCGERNFTRLFSSPAIKISGTIQKQYAADGEQIRKRKNVE